MAEEFDLERFVKAQEPLVAQVERELAAGRKQSHWMWFVFPQLKGLGHSSMAQHYGIGSLAEARAYLAHPVLDRRLLGGRRSSTASRAARRRPAVRASFACRALSCAPNAVPAAHVALRSRASEPHRARSLTNMQSQPDGLLGEAELAFLARSQPIKQPPITEAELHARAASRLFATYLRRWKNFIED